MVMLSTDKAVDPINVMGASKRLAEILMLKAHQDNSGTNFLSVRFGNVLGSRGSVVSLFLQQIERGRPVTVTDSEATRYFMTIKEASLLVIQASSIGKGGEIFILNMGERIEIIELARTLILLSGYEPDRDIHIEFTKLRPGEKLHEELMTSSEAHASELGKQLVILRPHLPDDLDLEAFLKKMDHLADEGNERGIAQNLLDFASKVENHQ
jgi:FlaA1/EpsC-like NDP-sugar epimerase